MNLRLPFLGLIALLPLWAQTSGGTAPEVTQFEPVDITDLVNLANGDFSYAVPVMAIPGAPGGQYPLSLSYHAGVLHGQEASWVGLGWNLQPGSVSRFVRSVPDDYHGALIRSRRELDSVYNYNVGFGYKGWSAGIHWDNHGGFGGSVGLSGVGGTTMSGSGSIGYHNRNGFSADVGIRSVSTGIGLGLTHSQHGDLIGSVSYAQGKNNFVGISSTGNIGYAVLRKSYKNESHTTNSLSLGGITSVNSRQVSVSVGAFNFGWGRTQSILTEASEAWGAIHLDKIGENSAFQRRRSLNFDEHVNTSLEINPETRELFQQRAEGHRFHSTYQRRNERSSETSFSHVGLALDTYYQDFQKGYAPAPSDNDANNALAYNQAYEADYITTSFDGYSIAAQGLAGMAKPVHSQRGFLAFSDPSAAIALGDSWHFYPYRNLYQMLDEGRINWDADLEAFFAKSPWRTETERADNMVMLTDPGLLTDHHLFPSLFDENGQPTQALGDGALRKRYATHNRSQRIRYELDREGRIARIIVTNPDGIIYTFGLLQDEHGLTLAGARPMNLYESTFSRVSDHTDEFTSAERGETHKTEPYAYAWYLAAVTSPDFVDNAPLGHYGPEDFGDYITFHYALSNPSYHWRTPYSHTDTAGEEPSYALTGRNSHEDQFHFQRNSGFKDFYHPIFAKTRTHAAVFEHDHARTDNLSAVVNAADSGVYNENPTLPVQHPLAAFTNQNRVVYSAGVHFFSAASFVNRQDSNSLQQHFLEAFDITPEQNLELILLLPSGSAGKWGLAANQEIDFGFVRARGQALPGRGRLTYLGNWDYGHYDVFRALILAGVPPSPPPPTEPGPYGLFSHISIHQPEGMVSTFNGSIKLKGIRLYARGGLMDDSFFQTSAGNGHRDLSSWMRDGAWADQFINEARFSYTQTLAQGYANVAPAGGGKLTLNEVNFYNRPGEQPLGNGYQFEYHTDSDFSLDRAHYRKGPWGYPSGRSERFASRVDERVTQTDAGFTVPIQALDSLSAVITPVGSRIEIEYERDRFSRIQDRFAVNRDQPLTFIENNSAPMLVDYVRALGGEGRFQNLDGRPLPLEQILARLSDFTWTWTANDPSVFQEQVLVLARGASRENCPYLNESGECIDAPTPFNSNHHRFVLPTKRVNDGSLWSLAIDKISDAEGRALHPSIREFASWIWHEIDHPAGGLIRLQIQQIQGRQVATTAGTRVVVPLQTNFDDPYSVNPTNVSAVGEIAGSLRVKQVKIGPSQVAGRLGDEMTSTISYDYRDPDLDLDSGVIFADPSGYIQGVGGDRRLLRSEAYPYLFMPGADISYGVVTSKQLNARIDTGSTRFRFLTAAHPAVVHGTFTESVKPYQHEVSLQWDDAQPHTQLLQYKTLGEQDRPWEAGAFNRDEPVIFSLDFQVRSRVVNQSGLIGRPIEEVLLSQGGFPIRTVSTEYRAAFDPEKEAIPVVQFFRNAEGRLQEADLPGDPSVGSLNPLMPGVHAEQHFGLLIGRHDGDGKRLRVKALFQDELWNTYRPIKSSVDYVEGNYKTRLESAVVAVDFSTGSDAITETRSLQGDGKDRFMYVWQIPAHDIWDAAGDQGMKQKNMLAQPGFKLSLVSDTSLRPTTTRSWLQGLAEVDTDQLYASVEMWRKGLNASNPDAWYSGGSASFLSDLNRNADQVLNSLQFTTASDGFWDISYPNSTGGRWELAIQNTAYNSFGLPAESRDRLGTFSSVLYDTTQRRPIANFGNARLNQVYYEGFESYSEITGSTYPPSKENPHNHTLVRLNAPAAYDLSPETYMAQYSQVYSGLGAAVGPVTLDFVPVAPAGEPERPYWLSFFCRPDAGNNLRLQIPGWSDVTSLPLTARRPQSKQRHITVSPAPNGWLFVKLKLNRSQFGAIVLGQTGLRIDDIVVYPAGTASERSAFVNFYAYDPHFKKMTASTDARGRTVRYQFNQDGELWRIFDGDGHLREEYQVLEHQRIESTPLPQSP